MKLIIPDPKTLPFQHPDYPWYLGSPDGIIVNPSTNKIIGGVDFKTTGYSKRDDWGEAGTDDVPDWIHCQADWYLGLTGAEWWDIAVLFMGARREFRIYRIKRNQEVIDSLIHAGKEFWENHILKEVPPPIDGSEASKRYLSSTYPQEREPLMDADDDLSYHALILKKLKEELKDISAEISEEENILKAKIGDHAGIQGSWGKVTWTKNKESIVTDWKGVFDEWAELDPTLSAIIREKHTTIKPGLRVFRTYYREEK